MVQNTVLKILQRPQQSEYWHLRDSGIWVNNRCTGCIPRLIVRSGSVSKRFFHLLIYSLFLSVTGFLLHGTAARLSPITSYTSTATTLSCTTSLSLVPGISHVFALYSKTQTHGDGVQIIYIPFYNMHWYYTTVHNSITSNTSKHLADHL